jgi:hypothetical protein
MLTNIGKLLQCLMERHSPIITLPNVISRKRPPRRNRVYSCEYDLDILVVVRRAYEQMIPAVSSMADLEI